MKSVKISKSKVNTSSQSIDDKVIDKQCGYFQTDRYITTVYVGNLSYDKNEYDVRDMFAAFGIVKYVKLVTDLQNGRSKGIAFIQMPNKKHATLAISKLDGTIVDNRTLKVSIAKERLKDQENIKVMRKSRPKEEKVVAEEIESALDKPIRRRKVKGLQHLFNYLNK